MGWNKKTMIYAGMSVFAILTLVGCSISYSFTGAGSIDYSKIKTIAIADFPITATYVYAPLATRFNDELKDLFTRQTKLEIVRQNADLELEGEITEYNQYNESVAADGYSSRTKLVVSVNIRYTNNTNHDDDQIDQKFSAFRTYDSSQLLTDVQDQLLEEIVKELIEQIFFGTVANW